MATTRAHVATGTASGAILLLRLGTSTLHDTLERNQRGQDDVVLLGDGARPCHGAVLALAFTPWTGAARTSPTSDVDPSPLLSSSTSNTTFTPPPPSYPVWLAAGHLTGTITIWDLSSKTGTLLKTVTGGHTRAVTSLCFLGCSHDHCVPGGDGRRVSGTTKTTTTGATREEVGSGTKTSTSTTTSSSNSSSFLGRALGSSSSSSSSSSSFGPSSRLAPPLLSGDASGALILTTFSQVPLVRIWQTTSKPLLLDAALPEGILALEPIRCGDLDLHASRSGYGRAIIAVAMSKTILVITFHPSNLASTSTSTSASTSKASPPPSPPVEILWAGVRPTAAEHGLPGGKTDRAGPTIAWDPCGWITTPSDEQHDRDLRGRSASPPHHHRPHQQQQPYLRLAIGWGQRVWLVVIPASRSSSAANTTTTLDPHWPMSPTTRSFTPLAAHGARVAASEVWVRGVSFLRPATVAILTSHGTMSLHSCATSPAHTWSARSHPDAYLDRLRLGGVNQGADGVIAEHHHVDGVDGKEVSSTASACASGVLGLGVGRDGGAGTPAVVVLTEEGEVRITRVLPWSVVLSERRGLGDWAGLFSVAMDLLGAIHMPSSSIRDGSEKAQPDGRPSTDHNDRNDDRREGTCHDSNENDKYNNEHDVIVVHDDDDDDDGGGCDDDDRDSAFGGDGGGNSPLDTSIKTSRHRLSTTSNAQMKCLRITERGAVRMRMISAPTVADVARLRDVLVEDVTSYVRLTLQSFRPLSEIDLDIDPGGGEDGDKFTPGDQDITTLNPTDMEASRVSSAHDLVSEAVGECIETAAALCVSVGATDVFFTRLFTLCTTHGAAIPFLRAAASYIVTHRVSYAPPEVFQALVDHFTSVGDLNTVQRCVMHLDLQSVDFNQVARLCRKHQLYTALAHLFLRGLADLGGPVGAFLETLTVSSSHREGRKEDGDDAGGNERPAANPNRYSTRRRLVYRLLVLLRGCAVTRIWFPPGSPGRPATGPANRLQQDALACLLCPQASQLGPLLGLSRDLVQRLPPRYPVLTLLTRYDPAATAALLLECAQTHADQKVENLFPNAVLEHIINMSSSVGDDDDDDDSADDDYDDDDDDRLREENTSFQVRTLGDLIVKLFDQRFVARLFTHRVGAVEEEEEEEEGKVEPRRVPLAARMGLNGAWARTMRAQHTGNVVSTRTYSYTTAPLYPSAVGSVLTRTSLSLVWQWRAAWVGWNWDKGGPHDLYHTDAHAHAHHQETYHAQRVLTWLIRRKSPLFFEGESGHRTPTLTPNPNLNHRTSIDDEIASIRFWRVWIQEEIVRLLLVASTGDRDADQDRTRSKTGDATAWMSDLIDPCVTAHMWYAAAGLAHLVGDVSRAVACLLSIPDERDRASGVKSSHVSSPKEDLQVDVEHQDTNRDDRAERLPTAITLTFAYLWTITAGTTNTINSTNTIMTTTSPPAVLPDPPNSLPSFPDSALLGPLGPLIRAFPTTPHPASSFSSDLERTVMTHAAVLASAAPEATAHFIATRLPALESALLTHLDDAPNVQYTYLTTMIARSNGGNVNGSGRKSGGTDGRRRSGGGGGSSGSTSTPAITPAVTTSTTSSTTSSVLESPVMQDRYLKLLCEFNPLGVLPFLTTHSGYDLVAGLRHCRAHWVRGGAMYLLERMGDVVGAARLAEEAVHDSHARLVRACISGRVQVPRHTLARFDTWSVDNTSGASGRSGGRTAGAVGTRGEAWLTEWATRFPEVREAWEATQGAV